MNVTWQPSADFSTLKTRAKLLRDLREFFHERHIIEVETPLLCSYSVTDPFIQSIPVHPFGYLQTSPEYAMKRLIAAGSGSIFQITKAFRQDECGRFHNPEFTLLEWYRMDFDHHQLMDEMDELLKMILNCESADRFSYQELFELHFKLNPHTASESLLHDLAKEKNCLPLHYNFSRDDLLQLLLSHCIEPFLGAEKPVFIYDFPASQAALSRINEKHPHLASRFEVYFKGVELANGFHELQDAAQQKMRFEDNQRARKKMELPRMEIDPYFIEALTHGLPNCAGVALGVDRLLMLKEDKKFLSEVMSFDFGRV